MKFKDIAALMFLVVGFNCGISIVAMMTPKQQQEAFFEACSKGDLEGVKNAIDQGVDVNVKGAFGWTGLHKAASRGDIIIVRYLVEHGADIFAQDYAKMTAYLLAKARGFDDITNYLLVKETEKSQSSSVFNQIYNYFYGYTQPSTVAPALSNIKIEDDAKEERVKSIPVQIKQNRVEAVESPELSKKKNKIYRENDTAQNITNNFKPQLSQKQITNQNQRVHSKQNIQTKVFKRDNAIHIYEYFNKPGDYREIILYKNCQNCILPGVYCKVNSGLIPLKELFGSGTTVYNPLENLNFTKHVINEINGNDVRHNFSTKVEEEIADWARIVIKFPLQNKNDDFKTKEYDFIITFPGKIIENRKIFEGVFEFGVLKSSLDQIGGLCTHRFFAPKGVVGAVEFGAKARNKTTNK